MSTGACFNSLSSSHVLITSWPQVIRTWEDQVEGKTMVDARDISGKQKQIAVSEFFEKNKHFLGFDSLQRSLITAVKEAVDNSLDACEEARILPNIVVEINRLKGEDIELISQDNGTGIPRDAIENVDVTYQTTATSNDQLVYRLQFDIHF